MPVTHYPNLIPIWLWSLAVEGEKRSMQDAAEYKQNQMFAASVLALTDIHYTRVHSSIMNRISRTIWITLYLVAMLSMMIMGYQAGLIGKRSPVATVTMVVAFSAVIILINDLDRYMQQDLQSGYHPGNGVSKPASP